MDNDPADLDEKGIARILGKVNTKLAFFALIVLLLTSGMLGSLGLTALSPNQDYSLILLWAFLVTTTAAAVYVKKPGDLGRVDTRVLKELVASGGLDSVEETLRQREHETEQEGDKYG